MQHTSSHAPERFFPLLALLWLALLLPDLSARYSFGWDSSQFDRGAADFDIARHQPHPPGYPLWVLAIRRLSPILGNPNRAQVVLALLFTLAALWFFRALARDLLGERAALSATALLAFSPLTLLNANSSQVYAVDLFASCFAGWLGAGLRSGRTRLVAPGFAVLAACAGFRPSGVIFLLPLLCFCLWGATIKKPAHAAAGILAGAACWLAWFVPTAVVTGGFSALAALNRVQMEDSFHKTSIFYGAQLIVHLHMVVEVCIYFAMALAGFALPVAAALWWRRAPSVHPVSPARPAWATPFFFILWMAPNLALVYLFHCSQPGYLMLSLPPLALLLCWLACRVLNGARWTAAGLAAALLVSYFPYERFINPYATTLPFLLLRSTPRITRLIEASQRDIRALIDSMPGGPEEKLLFCQCLRFEAPNIRTVTYDFSDVAWAGSYNPGTQVASTVRSIAWVCAGTGLPAAVHEQFPQVRRVSGNNLYSLWAATR